MAWSGRPGDVHRCGTPFDGRSAGGVLDSGAARDAGGSDGGVALRVRDGMLSDLRYRLRALFGRKHMEAELDEELRLHVEREAEKYRRAGMSEEEARRRARMAFGGHEQMKEDVREARGTSLVENTMQDARYALRQLRANPVFATVMILTLALAIGANSAIFSVVDGVLLRKLPYPQADRIVRIFLTSPTFPRFPLNPWDFRDFRDRGPPFTGAGGVHTLGSAIVGRVGAAGDAERVRDHGGISSMCWGSGRSSDMNSTAARSAEQRAGSDPERSAVADTVRRRSEHPGTKDHTQRDAIHSGGRDAEREPSTGQRIPSSGLWAACRCVDAVLVRGETDAAWVAFHRGIRAAEGWGNSGRGAGRPGRDHGGADTASREPLARAGGAVGAGDCWSEPADAADVAGRGGHGAADCVRECCESAAGTCGEPQKRAGRATGAGCPASTAGTADADGEPDSGS